MVDQMEVIVQKQKREKTAVFNDSGAGLHVFMGAVLGKCTDLEQARARRRPQENRPKAGSRSP